MFDDPRWADDPRDRDDGSRDLSPGSRAGSDPRERDQVDPRDAFMEHVDLPRGEDREHVYTRDHVYKLRGSETRTLTTVGAFRVVPASDLRDKFGQSLGLRSAELRHLRESGLVNTARLDRDTSVVTLTKEGRDLLESRRHDVGAPDRQAFHAGIQRPRELKHDAQVYRAYARRGFSSPCCSTPVSASHASTPLSAGSSTARRRGCFSPSSCGLVAPRCTTAGTIGRESITCTRRRSIEPSARKPSAPAVDARPCHPPADGPRRHRGKSRTGVAGDR